MASTPRLPVLDTVGEAVLILRDSWRAVLGALLLATVGAFLVQLYTYVENPNLNLGFAPLMIGSLMAAAGIYRRGLAAGHPGDPEFKLGPAGLQWGMPEWRLIGAAVLIFLVMLPIVFGGAVVVVVVAMLTGAMSGLTALGANPEPQAVLEAIGPAGILAYLALFLVIGWVSLRLLPYGPVTVAQKRVSPFEAWPMTKGRVLPILGIVALTRLPMIASLVIITLAQAVLGKDGAVPSEAGYVLAAFSAVVSALIQAPLGCAANLAIYRRLRRDDARAAAAFA